MLPKATNTPERLDIITGAQREDSGDGMLSKLLLSIGRCSSGNHGGNSSSGSCMTTAIDMAGDGESVRRRWCGAGGERCASAAAAALSKKMANEPPSGAFCRSDIAAATVVARSFKSNPTTLERLRGVSRL